VNVHTNWAATTSGAVLASVAMILLPGGVAGADLVVDELTGFTSPSGNIGCVIEPSYVRCDIRERDWSAPPRPPGCEFDYGQGISLSGALSDAPSGGQGASFVCAGDTALGGGAPLDYGSSISAGTVTCTSTLAAMSCTDSRSGHGFTMSRQSYATF